MRLIVCSCILTALLLTARLWAVEAEPAGVGFTQAIPAAHPPGGEPAASEGAWHHGQSYLPGLGFEVTLGGWPRLLQRGFLDVLSNRNGNREVYDIAGWQDLGEVRLPGHSADEQVGPARKLQANWCYRLFEAGIGQDSLRFLVSRLSPAVLFETSGSRIELFAGGKQLGSSRREGARSGVLPAHVAYVTGGKVVEADANGPVDLSRMEEPWLLLWFGRQSPYNGSTIPNLVWKMAPVKEYLENRHFVPTDLPVLVVFQRRPRKLESADDAVGIFFDEAAGNFAMMPLLGFYHIPTQATAAWADNGLPADVVERCRAWSARLMAYPLTCAESHRVDADGSVTIGQDFTYRLIDNDWNLAPQKLAPIPPVAALAAHYGYTVSFSGQPATHQVITHSGPYTGVAGADRLEMTIHGLGSYVDEVACRSRSSPTGGENEKLLAAELADELASVVKASRLAPAALYYKRHWQEYVQQNPGLTVLALAEAIPHLKPPLAEAVAGYAFEHVKEALTAAEAPNFRGARREYYPVAPLEVQQRLTGSTAAGDGTSSVSAEQRADNAYPLWLLAHATGRWDELRAHWPAIKACALDNREMDWAICGYVRGPKEERRGSVPKPGEDRGSVAAVNGRFARWVALARLARQYDEPAIEQEAFYRLARTALLRCAQGRLIDYMYDSKIQTITAEPDWMLRLSTWMGNGGGQGLIWSDHWTGAEGDVRCVIRWDDHGPVISQAFGDHWMPVIPRFLNLTPECGRFLHDNVPQESRRFVRLLEHNCQVWYETGRPSNIGKETWMDDPRNAYGTFLGAAYVLHAPADRLMVYQDIPYWRLGDMFHIRKLTATLWALGGGEFEPLRGGAK